MTSYVLTNESAMKKIIDMWTDEVGEFDSNSDHNLMQYSCEIYDVKHENGKKEAQMEIEGCKLRHIQRGNE